MAEDIIIRAGFEGSAVKSGLDKLRNSANSFSSSLTGKLTGAFAGAVLLDRGIGMASRTFEKFSDISDRALRAGVTAEEFQRLGYAAELSGTSIDAAAKALREIRRATAEASEGNVKAIESLTALGYTDAEVRGGNLKSLDVLLKLAAQYKKAGTEAEKFALVTSILSARTGSEMMPFMAETDQTLEQAMSRDVVDNDTVDQMKVLADQAKLASQALELLTANTMGLVMKGWSRTALVLEAMIGQVEDAADASKEEGISVSEKIKREKAALSAFEDYARHMRTALLGSTIDGQFMDAATVEGIINQKADENLGADLSRKRRANLSPTAAGALANVGAPDVASSRAAIASSMASIGGGGGVYGPDAMVNLADRTATATERTAAAVERLAGMDGASPFGSPVSPE